MEVNFMKKILISLICCSLMFTIVSCGNNTKSESNDNVNIEENAEKAGENNALTKATKQFPKFKSQDIDGKEFTEEVFKESKLTLVNIWGTWCGPCVSELPELQELSVAMKEKNVNVIGIVQDGKDSTDVVKNLMEKKGINFTNIIPNDDLYQDVIASINAFPTSMIVNDKGEVVKIVSGSNTKDGYTEIINEFL